MPEWGIDLNVQPAPRRVALPVNFRENALAGRDSVEPPRIFVSGALSIRASRVICG